MACSAMVDGNRGEVGADRRRGPAAKSEGRHVIGDGLRVGGEMNATKGGREGPNERQAEA